MLSNKKKRKRADGIDSRRQRRRAKDSERETGKIKISIDQRRRSYSTPFDLARALTVTTEQHDDGDRGAEPSFNIYPLLSSRLL